MEASYGNILAPAGRLVDVDVLVNVVDVLVDVDVLMAVLVVEEEGKVVVIAGAVDVDELVPRFMGVLLTDI